MRTLLSSFVLVLVALIALPETAGAQSRSNPIYDSIMDTYARARVRNGYRGGYNRRYWDPIEEKIVDDQLKTPRITGACQLANSVKDPQVQVATNCHWMMRNTLEELQEKVQSMGGNFMLGTQHAQKGMMHFKPADQTIYRMGQGTAGALGAGAGAAVGAAMDGALGAGIMGTLGAIVAGSYSGRHIHDGCIPIEVQPPATASSVVSLGTSMTSTEGSVVVIDTVNTTDFLAVVKDNNTGIEIKIPAKAKVSLPEPAGKKPYSVVLLTPGAGMIDRKEGRILPGENDPTRWEILGPPANQ